MVQYSDGTAAAMVISHPGLKSCSESWVFFLSFSDIRFYRVWFVWQDNETI